MNIENLLTILGSGTLTAIVGYFTGKRRANAETDNQVIKNLELSVNVYAQIIHDLKEEIESLNIRIQELEKKINDLHEENKRLKSSL